MKFQPPPGGFHEISFLLPPDCPWATCRRTGSPRKGNVTTWTTHVCVASRRLSIGRAGAIAAGCRTPALISRLVAYTRASSAQPTAPTPRSSMQNRRRIVEHRRVPPRRLVTELLQHHVPLVLPARRPGRPVQVVGAAPQAQPGRGGGRAGRRRVDQHECLSLLSAMSACYQLC